MKISCICPTHGRPPDNRELLEECIESFVRQDYLDAELIVYNDAADQTLTCAAERVTIINHPARHRTLGAKYNAAIDACNGELICPWEDDDISLPWRLSQSVSHLGTCDYWSPRRYWHLGRKGLTCKHKMGIGHNCSIFRRDAWEMLGRYRAVTGHQDRLMHNAFREGAMMAPPGQLPVNEWSYIYRWCVGSRMHLSARRPECQRAWNAEGQRELESGLFFLDPHWQIDYVDVTRRSAKETEK